MPARRAAARSTVSRLPKEAEDGILAECAEALLRTQRRIRDAVTERPRWAFAEVPQPHKGPDHVTTRVDLFAEAIVRKALGNSRYGLKVEGEETGARRRLDLGRETGPVAIVDMIDGTDLFTRGLGNWCSAMAVLHPPTEEILGALVGIPLGDQFKLFVAGRSYRRTNVLTYDVRPGRRGSTYRLSKDPKRAGVPAKPHRYVARRGRPLDGASISFYGQKRGGLLHLRDKTRFPWHRSLENSGKLRIYTLAGNPMLAKLAEGQVSGVFEPRGQEPYDCVPGLFIAKKAGAVVGRLDGGDLDLGRALKAGKKLTYVAGCSEALVRELRPLLRKK